MQEYFLLRPLTGRRKRLRIVYIIKRLAIVQENLNSRRQSLSSIYCPFRSVNFFRSALSGFVRANWLWMGA